MVESHKSARSILSFTPTPPHWMQAYPCIHRVPTPDRSAIFHPRPYETHLDGSSFPDGATIPPSRPHETHSCTRNRSAAIRIPLAGTSPAAKRIEFRAPDPSCNPFLAFSAQLMAGLDGILNHIEPPEPVDKDLYELPPEEHAGIKQVPSSLAEAMDALEEDHDFLTAGDVFTDDLIETWLGIKRGEIDQARLAPTPLEYELYFHI